MTDMHRWRGYSHDELYQQLNSGPGAEASTRSMDRWSQLTDTLAEIDGDISSGVAESAGSWTGKAAESARTALQPLGDWASQASGAADVMRASVQLQADYVSKARAEMPTPVPVTAEQPGGLESTFTHLFGGQTDYELQEARSNAAALRAFEVMTEYEQTSQSNAVTLGEFAPPPQIAASGQASTDVLTGGRFAAPSVPVARGGGSASLRGSGAARGARVRSAPAGERAPSAVAEEPSSTRTPNQTVAEPPELTPAAPELPDGTVSPSGATGTTSATSTVDSPHESYLVRTDDGYGGERDVSPPVIGESSAPR